MKEVGPSLISLSAVPPRNRSAKSSAGPSESFQSSEPGVNWLQKPNFDQKAEEPTRSGQRSLGVGHKIALITAGLAAGAGAIGVATAHPGPTNPQVQLSNRDANKAESNFEFLQQVAQSQGGSLKSDPSTLLGRVFHHQSPVNAQGAVQALSQGYTVYLYPSADSEGIPIRSTDQLKSITSQAREEVAKANLKQGLENIKQGLKNVGENIREGLGDIFK